MSTRPTELPAWLAAAAEPEPAVIARIWATVDLDRALAGAGVPAETLRDDPHLGATVQLLRPADGEPIALVEPNTEGRLARILARGGEGEIGSYVASPVDLATVAERARAAGVRLGRVAAGPFGPSVLIEGPPGGPHLVIVADRAGTIGR